MPLKLVKSGDGWKVKDTDSGKTFSKAPLAKASAKRQKSAIEQGERKK